MSTCREDHEDWCPAKHLDAQPCACMRRQIDAALAPLARVAGLTSLTVFGGVGQAPQVRDAAVDGHGGVVRCGGKLEFEAHADRHAGLFTRRVRQQRGGICGCQMHQHRCLSRSRLR